MVVGTIMHDVVQPLVIHYHFSITYTETKSKVEGSQDGGREGDPRLSDLGSFSEF